MIQAGGLNSTVALALVLVVLPYLLLETAPRRHHGLCYKTTVTGSGMLLLLASLSLAYYHHRLVKI
jgi:hypothetical protein